MTSSAVTRSFRIRLTLLCAAVFALFFAAFYFVSRAYLQRIELESSECRFLERAKDVRFRVETFLDFNGYTEIRQLYTDDGDDSQHPILARGESFLYVFVMDVNGFVVLHSDRSQEGTRLSAFRQDTGVSVREEIQHSHVKVDGVLRQVHDVSVPLALAGLTQGVLRVGYLHTDQLPPHETAVVARTTRNHALVVLAIFLLLAVALVWRLSSVLARRHEAETQQQRQNNEQQLELIGAGIVHEVKNSLNGIKMNAQLLQDQLTRVSGDVRDAFSKKVERIQHEATRTGDMLSEFLSYTKPAEFTPAPLNIAALLDDLAHFFEPECHKRRIQLRCECGPGLTGVFADEQQLRHGISNLLWNAIQAVDMDGWIALKGEHAGNRVCISVADSGGGMSPEEADKAFEVFHSTKPQGAGLGLSIVRRVALDHGGPVTLDNRTGDGCTFTISFPNELRNSYRGR